MYFLLPSFSNRGSKRFGRSSGSFFIHGSLLFPDIQVQGSITVLLRVLTGTGTVECSPCHWAVWKSCDGGVGRQCWAGSLPCGVAPPERRQGYYSRAVLVLPLETVLHFFLWSVLETAEVSQWCIWAAVAVCKDASAFILGSQRLTLSFKVYDSYLLFSVLIDFIM